MLYMDCSYRTTHLWGVWLHKSGEVSGIDQAIINRSLGAAGRPRQTVALTAENKAMTDILWPDSGRVRELELLRQQINRQIEKKQAFTLKTSLNLPWIIGIACLFLGLAFFVLVATFVPRTLVSSE